MKRSNTHVAMGLGFVAAAVAVAGSLYFGIKAGGSVELPPSVSNEVVTDPSNGAMSANEAGSIASENMHATAQTMADGQEQEMTIRKRMIVYYYSEAIDAESRCEGSRWSFEADGTFEIVWTTVKEVSRGSWDIFDNVVSLSNIETTNTEDQTVKTSDDREARVRWTNGTLLFADMKLYPCRTAA